MAGQLEFAGEFTPAIHLQSFDGERHAIQQGVQETRRCCYGICGSPCIVNKDSLSMHMGGTLLGSYTGTEVTIVKERIRMPGNSQVVKANEAQEFAEPRLTNCKLCNASSNTKVLMEENGQRLLHCGHCQVVFLDPQPSLDALTDDFVDRHLTSEDRLKELFGTRRALVLRMIAAHIRREVPQPAKILDIGCAGGHFLERFLVEGEWEKFGVEASQYASEVAASKGIKVWQGMFSSLELPANFFDVITLLDVLCYFPDPLREIRRMRKILKPSGSLWIQLPLGEAQLLRNTSRLAGLLSRSTRSLFASTHLFYFSVHSLVCLLRDSGFRVCEVRPAPPNRHPNSYTNLTYRLFYGLSWLAWTLSFHRLQFGPSVLVKAVPSAGNP